MSKSHPYLLGSVNVVITANNHNPLFIDPNALASKKIVPTDWTVLEAGTTPEASLIRYANGVEWLIDQSRLQISESCDHSFKDDYLIYGLADAYLEKVPHAPYQNLGLNYVVNFAQDTPRQWLLERFVPSYLRSKNNIDVFAILPTMYFDTGRTLRSLCKLEVSVANTQGDDNDTVVIKINIDHGGPLNADDMRAAIGLWKEKQDFLISTLDAIFKET